MTARTDVWFVQTKPDHVGVSNDIRTLRDLHHEVVEFSVEPFTHELSIPTVVNGIVRGSVQAIQALRGNSGVFLRGDEENNYQVWVDKLGDRMLNHDGRATTWGELIAPIHEDAPDFVHVRPVVDLKAFSGFCMQGDAEGMFARLQRTGNQVSVYQHIWVSPYKNIVDEFRIAWTPDWQIGRKTRENGVLRVTGLDMTDEEYEACQELTTWSPHDVFVADYARLADGSFKIVEFNCWNCSGWNGHDLHVMYESVQRYYDTIHSV